MLYPPFCLYANPASWPPVPSRLGIAPILQPQDRLVKVQSYLAAGLAGPVFLYRNI